MTAQHTQLLAIMAELLGMTGEETWQA